MLPTITFKANSWHAWLVEHFSPYYVKEATDICQYMRWVGLATFFFTGLSLLIGAFLLSYLAGVAWDFAWLLGYVKYVGGEKPPAWEMMALVWNAVMVFGSLIFGGVWTGSKIKDANYNRKYRRRADAEPTPPKQPGFIRSAYRSFKDKVCFPVEVK